MAKSLDEKNSSFINDDIIREALKTGLKSIQASEDLVRETLSKCQNELNQGEKHQRNSKTLIMPWVYKLGAPLAAGALVLVLVFNGSPMMSKNQEAAAAPQASNAESVEIGSVVAADQDALSGDQGKRSDEFSITFDESRAPSATPSPEVPENGLAIKSFTDGDSTYLLAPLKSLQSSLNDTKNEVESDEARNRDVFVGAVSEYNTANSTQFTLNEAGVTRIQTVIPTGVDSEMLVKAKSYKELLNDTGYWALPLKNTNGIMEGLLTVNALNSENMDFSISSQDIIYTHEQKQYVISTHPIGAFISKNYEMMFDSDSLIKWVEAKGYKNVYDPVVVDINYGTDFLVFLEADRQELAIPFLIDPGLFGLESKRVYARDELFKIISEQMVK